MCGRKCSYKTYDDGYRNNCGRPECYIKLKATLKNKDGLTPNQRSAIGIRAAQTRICDNGKTVASNRMKRVHKNRKKMIDPITGKSLTSIIVEKTARTNKNTLCDNGLTIAQNGALKSAKTMNKRIKSETGETIKQFRIRKANETKNQIGNDGLDSYERAYLHGAGKNSSIKYYSTKLYYQGTYEKHFLDFMKKINKLDLLKRGPRVIYRDDGKSRTYRSDFAINNVVVEIKSTWSYHGLNKSKVKRNNVKFQATVEKGFRLIVIYNKQYLFEITRDVFGSRYISDDLLDVQHAIAFNETNFLALMNNSSPSKKIRAPQGYLESNDS
nr:hypothetical protein [Candidatus Sigynarchaeota archaeon]